MADYQKMELPELLADGPVRQLLLIVRDHPEWSVEQVFANLPKDEEGRPLLSGREVRTILVRLNLSTAVRRRYWFAKFNPLEEKDTKERKLQASPVPDRTEPNIASKIVNKAAVFEELKNEKVRRPPVTIQISPAIPNLIKKITSQKISIPPVKIDVKKHVKRGAKQVVSTIKQVRINVHVKNVDLTEKKD